MISFNTRTNSIHTQFLYSIYGNEEEYALYISACYVHGSELVAMVFFERFANTVSSNFDGIVHELFNTCEALWLTF